MFVSLRRGDCGVEPLTLTVQDDASLMRRTMVSSSGPPQGVTGVIYHRDEEFLVAPEEGSDQRADE